jgi:hypothetical protein
MLEFDFGAGFSSLGDESPITAGADQSTPLGDVSYGAPEMTTDTPTSNGFGGFIDSETQNALLGFLDRGLGYAIQRDQQQYSTLPGYTMQGGVVVPNQAQQAANSRMFMFALIIGGVYLAVR